MARQANEAKGQELPFDRRLRSYRRRWIFTTAGETSRGGLSDRRRLGSAHHRNAITAPSSAGVSRAGAASARLFCGARFY